jgi:hypothetical protein
LPESFDTDVAAQVIVTYLQGLFRTIRVLHDREQVEKQIEALLTGLGLERNAQVVVHAAGSKRTW